MTNPLLALPFVSAIEALEPFGADAPPPARASWIAWRDAWWLWSQRYAARQGGRRRGDRDDPAALEPGADLCAAVDRADLGGERSGG
ncbi:MAG: hypothetical protein WAM11_09515 [Cyanobium sp.]